jgi:hypothetical protein
MEATLNSQDLQTDRQHWQHKSSAVGLISTNIRNHPLIELSIIHPFVRP